MGLTVKDIDNNEDMVGKRIKLIKDVALSDYKKGEVATCDRIAPGGAMVLQGSDTSLTYAYYNEIWEVVGNE
jgi:hypothetical protein